MLSLKQTKRYTVENSKILFLSLKENSDLKSNTALWLRTYEVPAKKGRGGYAAYNVFVVAENILGVDDDCNIIYDDVVTLTSDKIVINDAGPVYYQYSIDMSAFENRKDCQDEMRKLLKFEIKKGLASLQATSKEEAIKYINMLTADRDFFKQELIRNFYSLKDDCDSAVKAIHSGNSLVLAFSKGQLISNINDLILKLKMTEQYLQDLLELHNNELLDLNADLLTE